ncbi:hypothetical protein [Flavobacterium caeni]|uniref:Uncharacterized protein n=1 Tax=Flavobacterium caeni TaxID=490189 RepID=A0A1G5K4N2_9FLAO|nr:hypothetical protein [Flavobacterium caeni]SCY94849.1 hypothetical protein SAMN02927903_03058 [Flavobacterium caeni]
MYWSTLNFSKLVELLVPTFLRKNRTLAFLKVLTAPMQIIAAENLYRMQHDGRTMYLEKMLNEHYGVSSYNHQDHENTKLIYIDTVSTGDKLYIFQDIETEVSFLEDDDIIDDDLDLFLEEGEDNTLGYSFIIFMPDTITFNEIALRALVDSYRYLGYKYIIEIYTP